ncbi:uncharacterized protein HMPREF1541_00241 [Cyphellophora europaea CBS 101466]|uniref:Uncharacterized protein n=1 Tax=Cyphellophora europaea (strain CBS 101466) TaxID=1220924 RepID=W2SDE7_CYPE1|nr:uncharacterized protein HMPREF1541_00241 [Cyphellophora europaea CBS 101466]ETN46058.1 hypothetical protein HMPREF1541_00241 [Cyphellophora europaea CBS 101466]
MTMRSKTTFTSICRACAQVSRPLNQSTTTTFSKRPSSTPCISQPTKPSASQNIRSFTTTRAVREHNTSQSPTNPATTPAPTPAPAPTQSSPPQPLSAADLLSRAPNPSTTPGPFLTATVTSLHASTAHATRTISLPSRHLRKSFLTQTHDLVHDPYSLLRVGDIIRYSAFTPGEAAERDAVKTELEAKRWARLAEGKRLQGRRREGDGKPSKRVRVRYVVRQVVTPFGVGLRERMAERAAAVAGKETMKKKSIVEGVQVREGVLRHGTTTTLQEAIV